VLLLARNDRSARNLAREFRERNIDKTYLALVNSSASSILKTKSAGTIKHPLLVDGNGRVGLHGGDGELGSEDVVREAHTDWELLGFSVRVFLTFYDDDLMTARISQDIQ
jgi:23S rRNA-/tRNA-specific pseudouridylate synthase